GFGANGGTDHFRILRDPLVIGSPADADRAAGAGLAEEAFAKVDLRAAHREHDLAGIELVDFLLRRGRGACRDGARRLGRAAAQGDAPEQRCGEEGRAAETTTTFHREPAYAEQQGRATETAGCTAAREAATEKYTGSLLGHPVARGRHV